MLSHPRSARTPTSAARTPPGWRPWGRAWSDAAYGRAGFWTRERPRDHFTTGVGVGDLVAVAVAGLVPPGCALVVDVGAGDGGLLAGLVDLLPCVALVGVDRRPRPPGLDPRVGWVVDHRDVEGERWHHGGPDAWTKDAQAPLLVAHEWLDDLPVPVVGRGTDGWHEVEVGPGGAERPGPPVADADRRWLARWWDEGRRAEVGRARDAAWADLVGAALARAGRALAVDYGHRAGERPTDGSFVAYGAGRRRTPVADGSVNLTAAVAVDAVAAAGERSGATTLLLERQAAVLRRVPPCPADDTLRALVRRSERSALTDPARWGDLWWLLQGAPP